MPKAPRRGLTLLETVISLLLIAVLMSILIPALTTARMSSYREQCANHQRRQGHCWHRYLEDHGRQFPAVAVQPGWLYGGMRFSSVDQTAFPDYDRPLTAYMELHRTANYDELICFCPADRGITDPTAGVGTGRRTAFRSFGTSYRANAALLDARIGLPVADGDAARGMHRREITTAPSRLVLSGDPVWYEAAEETGRTANWHGEPGAGNMLFLDGSVRFMTVIPRRDPNRPMIYEPVMPGSTLAWPSESMPRLGD